MGTGCVVGDAAVRNGDWPSLSLFEIKKATTIPATTRLIINLAFPVLSAGGGLREGVVVDCLVVGRRVVADVLEASSGNRSALHFAHFARDRSAVAVTLFLVPHSKQR